MVVLDSNNVQHKIRLKGIDAPERGQPYGKASAKSLSGMVAGKHVVVDYDKRDKYRRIIGKVLLQGRDIDLQQVERGYAWHYKYYQREQSQEDRQLYAEAQDDAKESRLGLWAESNPVPPWEWRKRKK